MFTSSARISILMLFSLFVGLAKGFVLSPTLGKNSRIVVMMAETVPEGIQQGTVKWFNTQKGFGFITPADGSGDVFVHQTSIRSQGFRSLADGEPVEYMIKVDGNGRRNAVSVTGPNGSDVQGAPFQRVDRY